MERYAKGLPIANGLAPIYEDDDVPSNGINPRTLDLVDIQELKMKNQDDIEYYQSLVSRKSNKKQPKNNGETSEEEESTN